VRQPYRTDQAGSSQRKGSSVFHDTIHTSIQENDLMKKAMISLFTAACLILTFAGASLAENPGTQVVELAGTGTSWDGSPLPAYPDGRPEITILSITVPLGEKLAIHRHPVINAGVLLSGQLRVHTLDGKVLDLKAGEAIVEVVNTWHWGESVGDTPAHIVVFYAGTPGVSITEKQK